MLNRVEVIGSATLYLGDCREILPTLGKIDAIVTDPPYGVSNNTDYRRFSGGKNAHARRKDGDGGVKYPPVFGDDKPFDPSPLLAFDYVILWGFNFYCSQLPAGGSLVWVKRKPEAFGSFLSDAELAWVKGSKGIFCFTSFPQAMAHERYHPTQKPVDLMAWCINKTTGTVCDPYMGAGSTAVACASLGRKFIGIEADATYFEIACQRLRGDNDAEFGTDEPKPWGKR